MKRDSNYTRTQKKEHKADLEDIGILLPDWFYEGMFEMDIAKLVGQVRYARQRYAEYDLEPGQEFPSIQTVLYTGDEGHTPNPQQVADYLFARYDNMPREVGERAVQMYCNKLRDAKEPPRDTAAPSNIHKKHCPARLADGAPCACDNEEGMENIHDTVEDKNA